MKAKKTNTKSKLTPMMKQYLEHKEKCKGYILFYRLGDFYEMFFDDAKIASKVLGLVLTTRGKHLDEKIPLAGFPHHHLESYLAKMVKAGYKVAVCDQVEDPKMAKGVVKREVVELVSGGTALSDSILDSESGNYIIAINYNEISKKFGFSLAEVTTGEFLGKDFLDENELFEAISIFNPSEILLSTEFNQQKHSRLKIYEQKISLIDGWKFDYDYAFDLLKDYLEIKSAKEIGFENDLEAIRCSGVLLGYIKDNLRTEFKHIEKLKKYQSQEFVGIDDTTRKNLELLKPISSHGDSKATLFHVLNKTMTKMGSRLLKKWILFPLKSKTEIKNRLDFIDFYYSKPAILKDIDNNLSDIFDIERIISKISTRRILPLEILKLKNALIKIKEIKYLLKNNAQDYANKIVVKKADKILDLDDLISYINSAIGDYNESKNYNSKGFIKRGFNQELDELYDATGNSKDFILELQNKVREEIGLPNLKVGYNKVFGYYFEVSKKYENKIPDNYIKKQTLVNSLRFINEELKVYEDKILNADEKIAIIEADLLLEIREKLIEYLDEIKNNSQLISYIDVISSLYKVASTNNYVRPEFNQKKTIQIKSARHPVVEQLLPYGEEFIPNDILINNKQKILIITGPNMSGKSTFLRQVALITLLAQMGSFVPAAHANIGFVDKIFTRVGASDNLAGGESTFLVEMNESANILNNATNDSLIIFDEVGRGTSTFDGLSLAWSMVEYIHNNPNLNSRTVFATHYHELTEVEKICERVKNYSVSVREYKDEVIFMRKIVEGGADNSYGIYVAKLAGIPQKVIERAKEILANLEQNELTFDEKPKIAIPRGEKKQDLAQMNLFNQENDNLREELRKINISDITPLEAINILNDLKKYI